MAACPNKKSQEWKDLSAALGEDRAMLAFIRNKESIPTVERGRELITNMGLLTSLERSPILTEESVNSILKNKDLITDEKKVINGKTYYKLNSNLPNIGSQLGDFTDKYGMILEYADTQYVRPNELGLQSFNSFSGSNNYKSRTAVEAAIQFLSSIGVHIATQNDVLATYGSNGVADFANWMVRIQEGMEMEALPEEALHFFLDMIDQSTPELLEALDKVRDLPIYKKTLNQYKDNPNYKTADGQIRFDKIKKEALAKHLAQLLKNKEMGSSIFAKVWNAIVNAIKSLKLRKDPMDFLNDMLLSGQTAALNRNLNSSEIYNQLNEEYQKFYQSQAANEEQMKTLQSVLSLTASIEQNPKTHKLTTIDDTGTVKEMKGVTRILGSDFNSELESPDVIIDIVNNYSFEIGVEAGVTLDDDMETTGKKLVNYITDLILQDKLQEEDVQSKLGTRIKELLYQATENKRKALFGKTVHSIVEAAVLNKEIDLDSIDPIIYNLIDRKTLERLVYGTASDPGLIGIIRQLKAEGNVVMTEIAVGNGQIGGIIDLIAIDKNGTARIFDFKTKFINPEKSARQFGTLEEYFAYATGLLSVGGVKDDADTLPSLVGKRRSQMEKYNQQLSVYKKLLMQFGIKVGDITIIGIPYTISQKTNKVSQIKPFVNTSGKFNDKIADGFFPNLDMSLDANASQATQKVEDDRIKLLQSISKEKMKEAFAKMEARLTQLYNYFRKNRDAKAVYDLLMDEATKTNRVRLQRDIVTDITNNFDDFVDMLASQRAFVEIIDSAGPVIDTLSKRFAELKALTPADTTAAKAKLQEMMKIRDFLVGYENMFTEMLEYTNSFEKDNPIVDRLNQMVGAIRNMRVEHRRGITPEIIKMLGEVFSKEEVDNMKREYNELIKSAEERGDKKRVEELKKERDELPSDKVIAELLNGNKGDVGWFFSKFLPAISNPDILIAGIAKRLKAVLDKVRLVNIEFRTRLGKEFDKRKAVYGSGLNLKQTNESLTYIQKSIDVRTGDEHDQLYFLSEFDEKLYYDYSKLLNNLRKAEEAGVQDDIKAAKKAVKDFQLKYLESDYTEEYFKITGILDAEVVYQGTKQTVREIRQKLFDEINTIQKKYPKDAIEQGEMLETDLMDLQALWERLGQLQEKTYPDGTKKTGDDLRIATILEKYAEKSKNIFENVELSGLFERKKERIRLTYGEGSAEYQKWLANNTRLVISDEYYNEMDAIMQELGQLTNDKYAEKKKELYAELRTLTKAFKDKDGYIKGQFIDQARLDRIAEVQREIDMLNALTDEYTPEGYTSEETKELKRQRYLSSITNPNDPLYGTYDQFVVEAIRNARDERIAKDADLKKRLAQIKELKNKLYSMRKSENTKYYYEELEKQEQIFADAAGVSYEELKKDNILYQQFRESAWYQQNHTHKVKNNFNDETGTSERSEAWEPIYIWRRNMPLDQYILEKPARHFYKNVLKDSYIDENGVEIKLKNTDNRDLQDRLKPKSNEQYKKQYGVDHPYLNQRFTELRTKYENNTANQKERVDYENLIYLHKELTDSQQDIEYRYRLGFAVPFMEKVLLQRTVESTGQNLMQSAKNMLETVERNFVRTEADINEGVPDVPSATSRLATVDNEEVKYIPVRFTSKSDVNNQSYDVWGSVLNYVSSINRKKGLEQELVLVNGLEELLADPENQPKKETRNLILNNIFKKVFGDQAEELQKRLNLGTNTRAEVIKSFINSVLYNEEYFEGYDVLGLNTQKVISRAMSLSSFTLLGFAPFNWTVNALSGNVQAMIEAAGGRFYNFRQFRSAKKQIYVDGIAGGKRGSIMKDMMADFGKVGARSFWGQLMEFYDPIQGEFENELGQNTSFNKFKNILSLGAFAGKIWGEWEIQTSSWIAFMENHKLYQGKLYDKESFITMKLGSDFIGISMKEYTAKRAEVIAEFEGLKVNLLDMHEMGEDGKVRIKDEYKDDFQIGSQQFSDIIAKLHAMQKRINGSYAAFDKAYVQKTSLGRMLFFFRRYFIQLGINRWGFRRPDYEGMTIEQGFYLTFYQTFIKDLLKFRFNVAKNWQSYSPQEKAAIRKTLVEIGIIMSVFALYSLLLGYDDDDEDRFKKLKQSGWGLQSSLFVLLKVNSETGQFLPIAGLEELNRIYSNPSILWNQMTSYISMSKMVLMHIGNLTPFFDYDKSLYYQKDSGESFLKEEGDSKFVAEFFRTFAGFTGKTFFPVDAVKGFEFSQQRPR